jgi:DNA invertase Pin-like site-specific DNA recombinase
MSFLNGRVLMASDLSEGWTVIAEYVREDEGHSGSTLLDRQESLSFLRYGERIPRSFDVLLVRDISRLSRLSVESTPTRRTASS